jgi:hypothetical protein
LPAPPSCRDRSTGDRDRSRSKRLRNLIDISDRL